MPMDENQSNGPVEPFAATACGPPAIWVSVQQTQPHSSKVKMVPMIDPHTIEIRILTCIQLPILEHTVYVESV